MLEKTAPERQKLEKLHLVPGLLNREIITGLEREFLGVSEHRCEGTKKLGDLTMRMGQTYLVSIAQERKWHAGR